MYLRRCHRSHDGRRHAYWALVKSVRTAKGPRQQVVAYLGDLDEAGRLGVLRAAGGSVPGPGASGPGLFEPAATEPRWVEVDTAGVRVEATRDFGGPWLALQLLQKLRIDSLLAGLMTPGREDVPWPVMSLVLVILRLIEPSSELRIAEHLYERSALCDLLGVGAGKVNDDRLYRALDALLPHKAELEKHLKNRLGELFDLKYDLLLYDMTSTYSRDNAKATSRRGADIPATTGPTASRSASGWWSAGAACRSGTRSSPATRPMSPPCRRWSGRWRAATARPTGYG